MKKRRGIVKRDGIRPEAAALAPGNELEEAAELLEQQEPPVPEAPSTALDDTNPSLIDPAD